MKELKISKEKQKEMLDGLERFQQDIVWFAAKKHDLFKDYPEEWVAVFNKTIVDHSKDIQALCDKMRKDGKHDPSECVVEFVTDEPDPIFCF